MDEDTSYLKMRVIFETKCYENDWEFLLKTPLLGRMISNCNHEFDERVLMINNVKNVDEVKKYASLAVKRGIIDKYYVVEDYAERALKFFGIGKETFKQGYGYSISELVSIYLARGDYLIHFSSDTIVKKAKSDWISEAIEKMEKDRRILVANPRWTRNLMRLKMGALWEDGSFYYGKGFSDQCYLVKLEEMKKKIYNETNGESDRLYPTYGGNLFEKRVNAYIRNHGLLRITSKKSRYMHKNFPKSRIMRRMEMHFIGEWGFDRFFRDYFGDLKKIFINRIGKLKRSGGKS